MQYSPTSQCWGKQRYMNKKAAKEAIKQVEAKYGERLNAYHCPYDQETDNHYHIGHKVQDTMKKLAKQEKKPMKHELTFVVDVEVECQDEALIDEAAIEGSERNAYGWRNRDQVIHHLAWNCVKNGIENAKRLDGWGDLEGDELTMRITHVEEY